MPFSKVTSPGGKFKMKGTNGHLREAQHPWSDNSCTPPPRPGAFPLRNSPSAIQRAQ